jgi:hypothetical protein
LKTFDFSSDDTTIDAALDEVIALYRSKWNVYFN